ncbi:MAG TPA: VOC family protein [Steroidobacteraceae bacterium]|jgi:predicted enzyme related to lactoylglutathione lyase
MTIQNAFASVAVKDVNESARWYEKLLDQPASKPMPELAQWSFERGGGLQVYQLPERAGAGSLTLAVDDIDDQVARLEKLHIDTSNRSNSERVRTVMITDPDGNHIAFAQAIDPKLAQ